MNAYQRFLLKLVSRSYKKNITSFRCGRRDAEFQRHDRRRHDGPVSTFPNPLGTVYRANDIVAPKTKNTVKIRKDVNFKFLNIILYLRFFIIGYFLLSSNFLSSSILCNLLSSEPRTLYLESFFRLS